VVAAEAPNAIAFTNDGASRAALPRVDASFKNCLRFMVCPLRAVALIEYPEVVFKQAGIERQGAV
jgi:hypothetical protein